MSKELYAESFLRIIEKDAKKNRYLINAATDGVDRQKERVLPAGCTNLPHFLQFGSLLASHDWDIRAVIAKPTAGTISEKALQLEIAFAETALGLEIKYLYDEGFASSFSIGFMPDFEKIDVIDGIRTYKEWELLEVSAVPVPANPEANILRTAESRRGSPLAAIRKMLDHEQRFATSPSPAGDQGDRALSLESPIVGVADKFNSKGRSIWTN